MLDYCICLYDDVVKVVLGGSLVVIDGVCGSLMVL